MTLKCYVLLAVLLLTGCSGLPVANSPLPESGDSSANQAYVVSHGWHTGIIVPAKRMEIYLPQLTERFSGGQWYEIGWGDKGFYQAQEVTTGLTLQAMFWSSGAVMHVVSVPTDPERYFSESDILNIELTDNQLNSLMAFIADSFERDEQGKIIRLKRGIYGNSEFYDAVGRYSIFNTCNNWTAKGLESAGMDISARFKMTADSVMDYLNAYQTEYLKSHAVPTICIAR
ncbi:TIGR02117 family protein [Budvicia diplopodorum]|uniref:TIGR02117 family protein n=1 Tax=Budvicia diplopodorum TaxID=1119056 RepID=UPI001FE86471|nr:TIGR02117 family protein [Budvicia diplopodorum]